MPSEKNSRIDGLTSIRAFAALHVVFYHMWGIFLPLSRDSWLFFHVINVGYLGVNLFFILSGYILSYVYLWPSPGPVVDRSRFWKARFARIYPGYAFAFLLEIPLVIVYVLKRNDLWREAGIAVGTLAANLSLLQGWCKVLTWRWNYPSWTLCVEAFFYFLFPFLGVWLWKNMEKRGLFLPMAGCYLLLLIPAILWWIAYPNSSVDQSPEWVFFNPALRIPEFTLGIFLMKLQTRLTSESEAKWGPLLFWGSLVGLLIGFSVSNLVPIYVLRSGILDPLFMGLILGIALSKGPIAYLLSAGPLVLLGEASYSIYILQAPMIEWFTWAGKFFNVDFSILNGNTNRPFSFTLFLVLLVVASILSYKYVEIPCREKIRKINFKLPTWLARTKQSDKA